MTTSDQTMKSEAPEETQSETLSQPASPRSKSPQPRPVARRACLSCREKKIKCDGELLPVPPGSEGPTCSNCRLMGLRCVFVQSNRGGCRRKRYSSESVADSADYRDGRRSTILQLSPRSSRGFMEPETPSTMSEASLSVPRLNSPSFGGPEPKRRAKEEKHHHHHYYHHHESGPGFFGSYGTSQHGNFKKHYPWEYGPPGPHGPRGPRCPPPGPRGMDLEDGNEPSGPPLPPHMRKPGPGPYGGGPRESSYPPHGGPYGFYYPPPPPPPPPHGPPRPRGPHFDYYGHFSHPPGPPGTPPPHFHFHPPPPPPPGHFPPPPPPPGHYSSEASSSMYFEERSAKDSEHMSTGTGSPASSPQSRFRKEAPEDEKGSYLFSNAELHALELPSWSVLNELLTFYFQVCHPNDQIFPSKNGFLELLSLRSDAALLHAIIARVCSLKKWNIDSRQKLWVKRAHKHSETLDDHGLLVCYALLRKVPLVKADPESIRELDSRFQRLLASYKYVQLMSSCVGVNMRTCLNKETNVRAVWSYWYDSIVEGSEEFINVFSEAESHEFPFPVPNDDYLKCKLSESPSWADFKQGRYNDCTSLIKAASILQKARDKSATREQITDSALQDFLLNSFEVKEGKVHLNSHMASARCLYGQAHIMQRWNEAGLGDVNASLSSSQKKAFSEIADHLHEVCEVIEASRGLVDHDSRPVAYGVSSLDGSDWRSSLQFVSSGTETWRKLSYAAIMTAKYARDILTSMLRYLEKHPRESENIGLAPDRLERYLRTIQHFLQFVEIGSANSGYY